MRNKNYYQLGYGGIEAFLAAAVVGLIIYFFFYPNKFNTINPTDQVTGSTYCREIINDANAPTLTAPAYEGNKIDPNKQRTYRLIKKNVPIVPYIWTGNADGEDWEHLARSFSKDYTDPQTGEKFVIRIPNGAGGRSYDFNSSFNPTIPNSLRFGEYGLLLLFHVDDTGKPLELTDLPTTPWGYPNIIDIYKAVDLPTLPEWVTQCVDEAGSVGSGGIEAYYPNPSGSPFRAEEQLNWFLFKSNVYVPKSWWVPHCKPAIYLYPEKETKINVQVTIPNGKFLYTDPLYPSGGWNVLAKPDGDLQYLGKDLKDSKGIIHYPSGIFPYMYYEAKIADSAIEKPTKGYVKKYDELASYYDEILPTLGLNKKETKEFKDYWLKALPQSPYYFVGIVSQENLDEIEPLTITPKQDTTIRVSLYFEALEDFKIVTAPHITTPARNGFTVVEWGGMLKRDKDHPFTCVE